MFMTQRERSGTKLPYTLFFAFKKNFFFRSLGSDSCLVCVLAEPRIHPGRGVVWDYSTRSQEEVSGMPVKKTPQFIGTVGGNTKEYAELSADCRCHGCALVPIFLLLGASHLINFTVNSMHRSILTNCHFDLSAGWAKKNAYQSLLLLKPE